MWISEGVLNGFELSLVRDWEDFVEKWPMVVQPVLRADESPRQVGRRIVIRLEPEAKVGRHNRSSTEPSNRGLVTEARIGKSRLRLNTEKRRVSGNE